MFFIFIFISLVFSQGLNDVNHNFYHRIVNEFENISNQNVSNELFIWPLRESKANNYYNILKDYSNNSSISPIMAARYSSSGFEINLDNPYPVLWITPGFKFSINHLLVNSLSPIWFHGEFKFYKHSAYGLDEKLSVESSLGNDSAFPVFLYNPDYQYGFYASVKTDDANGVDFDESNGYVSIMGNNFDLTFGKLKASLGPSSYSNLSLSHNMPVFDQLRFHYNYKNKIYLTFITGDLYSGIRNDSLNSYYSERLPVLPRKIYNHRIDFSFFKKLRLGFYEQIIANPNNSGSFSYLNPFQFYWSAQHQNGDLDNLQMGFDFDYIFSKYRIYGALLVDEWAPYDTFNDSAHNWFSRQVGISRIFNFNYNLMDLIFGYQRSADGSLNKNFKGILKFEYSSAEPQAYIHKFEINNPSHHDYPIGLWSGSNSIDKRLSFILFVDNSNGNNQTFVDFGYQNTRIGNPSYEEGISLLSGSEIKTRDLIYLKIQKSIFYDIDYQFKVGYYQTENLYSEDDFLDISTSLLYNIQK